MLLALLWGLNIGWVVIATYIPVLDISRFLLKANSQSQFDEGKLILFLVMKVLVEGLLCMALYRAFKKYAVMPLYVELGCTLGIILFIVVQVFVGNMRPMADSRYSLVYASDTPLDRLAYLMLLTPFLYSTVGFFNIFYLDSFMALATRTTFVPPTMDDDVDSDNEQGGDTDRDTGEERKSGWGIGNALNDLNPLSELNLTNQSTGPYDPYDPYGEDVFDDIPTQSTYSPPLICTNAKECKALPHETKKYYIKYTGYKNPNDTARRIDMYLPVEVYIIKPNEKDPNTYFMIDPEITLDEKKIMKREKLNNAKELDDIKTIVSFPTLLKTFLQEYNNISFADDGTECNIIEDDVLFDHDSPEEIRCIKNKAEQIHNKESITNRYTNCIFAFLKETSIYMDQTSYLQEKLFGANEQYRILYSRIYENLDTIATLEKPITNDKGVIERTQKVTIPYVKYIVEFEKEKFAHEKALQQQQKAPGAAPAGAAPAGAAPGEPPAPAEAPPAPAEAPPVEAPPAEAPPAPAEPQAPAETAPGTAEAEASTAAAETGAGAAP